MGKSIIKITFSNMKEAKLSLSEEIIRQVTIEQEDNSEVFSLNLANIAPICAAKTISPKPQPTYNATIQQSPATDKVDPDEAVRQWEEKMRTRQDANSFADKELYKVECKCGTEYYARMNSNSDRARCKECGEFVYADRFVPKKLNSQGEAATLVTNRYRVSFIGGSN